jgi:predicted Fe-Mo cluster-binding NifX family protein
MEHKMKIAVATNNNTNVTGHVGRCRAFIIYNIEDNKIVNTEIRENTFTHHAAGHGHNHGQHLGEGHGHESLVDALKDCSYLLFQGGGWRLIEDLKANNVKPFLTSEKIAQIAVEKLLRGELKEEENLTCKQH